MTGHVVTLWLWCLDNAPSGDVSKIAPKVLARAAQWDDDPDEFVGALLKVGFLDRNGDKVEIHDWWSYAGKLIDQRQANADKQKAWRERNRNVTVTGSNGVTLRNGATVPNPTEPNPTEQNMTKETRAATIPLHLTKPVSSNGEETPLGAVAPKAAATPQAQPLQPYEIQFLEIFGFRSGRYPTKAMRKIVQEVAEKYGETEFVAAANIAAGKNIRKLPYVEGILKRSKANNNRAGPGPPRGDMQKDFDMIDEVTAMIESGESYFGH